MSLTSAARPASAPAPGAVVTGPPRPVAVRAGALLLLAGIAAEVWVTGLHPHHEAPNDHPAVFAEYAASSDWIAVHLGQFAAGLVALLGLLTLLAGLGRAGAPPALVRAGTAATSVALSLLAVLQAVDGVALYRAVRAVAAAPPEQRAAAFADAETVRWVEEAVAGYAQVALGLAVLALAAAVLTARGLPRWSGVLPVVAGVAFVVQGVHVGYAGFTDTPAVLVSWPALALFAVVASVAAWVPRRP